MTFEQTHIKRLHLKASGSLQVDNCISLGATCTQSQQHLVFQNEYIYIYIYLYIYIDASLAGVGIAPPLPPVNIL